MNKEYGDSRYERVIFKIYMSTEDKIGELKSEADVEKFNKELFKDVCKGLKLKIIGNVEYSDTSRYLPTHTTSRVGDESINLSASLHTNKYKKDDGTFSVYLDEFSINFFIDDEVKKIDVYKK